VPASGWQTENPKKRCPPNGVLGELAPTVRRNIPF
jgi:hypothetical protein